MKPRRLSDPYHAFSNSKLRSYSQQKQPQQHPSSTESVTSSRKRDSQEKIYPADGQSLCNRLPPMTKMSPTREGLCLRLLLRLQCLLLVCRGPLPKQTVNTRRKTKLVSGSRSSDHAWPPPSPKIKLLFTILHKESSSFERMGNPQFEATRSKLSFEIPLKNSQLLRGMYPGPQRDCMMVTL